MRRQGSVVEDLRDGFGGEVWLVDGADDDTGDGFAADGNSNDGACCEFDVVMIRENVGASTEGDGGCYLQIVHRYSILYCVYRLIMV